MAEKVKITITTSDGEEFPCKLTLGAMRRFKEETGRDVSRMDGAADMAVLVWCCCKSQCNAEGKEMPYNLEDFTDRLDAEAISGFSALTDPQKKTMTASKK